MKVEQYSKLWETARNYASRRGFGDEAEDFASDLVLRKLEGKSRRQSLEQSFIDYSDKLRASKRVLSSPHGYCAKNLLKSIDQPIGSCDDDVPSIGDSIGLPSDELGTYGFNEFNQELPPGRLQIMHRMYFIEGFTQFEIGRFFNMTESRASQILKDLQTKSQILMQLPTHIRKWALQNVF